MIHVALWAQTETGDVCLHSCVLFLPLLNILSYTWNFSLFPPGLFPSPFSEAVEDEINLKSHHQQLVLCPQKGFEVSLRKFHGLSVYFS